MFHGSNCDPQLSGILTKPFNPRELNGLYAESDNQCNDGNARVTMVPFKPLSDQKG